MLFCDWETRGTVDLTKAGTYRYCSDPETENVILSYSFDDEPEQVWECLDVPMPERIREYIEDPFSIMCAWHATFERLRFLFGCGIDIPADRWIDPMIICRYLSMPASLDKAGEILNIGDAAKLKEGKTWIDMFSKPLTPAGIVTLWGIEPAFYRSKDTNPKEFNRFIEYGLQDIRALKAIWKKVRKFDLPDEEWEMYSLTEKINDYGVPIDRVLLQGSSLVVAKEKEYLTKQLKELTNLQNPNSNSQILGFVRKHGYSFSSVGKAWVNRALNGECSLDEEGKKCLELRLQLSKSSVSKLEALKLAVDPDGRVRHLLSFFGAARTGRYSSQLIQIQNLARPTKEVDKNFDRALELLKAGDHETISKEFSSPLDVATSAIRAIFRAEQGHKFVVADLSAIESRGMAWVTGCQALTKIFEENKDPYIYFAAQLDGHKTYEEMYAEWKAGNKTDRTNAKPGFLGCGYSLGPGEITTNEEGEEIRTGLMGYASAMSIDLPQELANKSVEVFRRNYNEIVEFWYELHRAFANVVENDTVMNVGPLVLQMKGNILCMTLPSGRDLHYVKPAVVWEDAVSRKGNTYRKSVLSCEGKDQKTKVWCRTETRGAKLFENAIQAICRDILNYGIFKADQEGFNVSFHVHDEIICHQPDTSPLGVEDLVRCMTTQPPWAKDFLLGAEGFETVYYCKQ